MFSAKFVAAGREFNELHKNVPAPYLRKNITLDAKPASAMLTVCGLGFYRLWVNGKEITKGILAPYISNPDHIYYYDEYDLLPYLREGRNTLGFLLGNGLLNNPGGFVWDFEEAPYRSAPKVSFALELTDDSGESALIEADTDMKTAPSPIYFDDLRCGERYDARLEIPGWAEPGFDDSGWANAIPAETPKGEPRVCEAEPVRPSGEVLKPVRVFYGVSAPYKEDYKKKLPPTFEPCGPREGWIFDFGKNRAGLLRVRVKGESGQRLEMQFAEYIDDGGRLNYTNMKFYPDGYAQRDVLICSGREDTFMPSFTYHGFSCVMITGLTEEQAKTIELEYVICHSDLKRIGGFTCSDPTLNTLYEMAVASDLSNFYYFPTDCPHREKNGWTGDAALSAEHFFMQYDCLKSMREWMRNLRAAQKPNGSLPGIAPTNGWGYDTGPSWDICLVEIPYQAYAYTGDRQILEENADAIWKYIEYLYRERINPEGLFNFGLGDWCSVDWKQLATQKFTCSVTVYELLRKAGVIFNALDQKERCDKAAERKAALFDAIRTNMMDIHNRVADTRCQTSQAMALYYGLFEEEEMRDAFWVLTDITHENNDFLDVGILGARVLFRVLSQFGYADLAYKMMCRPEWPSYGHWIEQGLTALSEEFIRDDGTWDSRNHHMFGDISGWMINCVAGLYKAFGVNFGFEPCFPEAVSSAGAWYESADGRVGIQWERKNGRLFMQVVFPETVRGSVPVIKYETVGKTETVEAGSVTVCYELKPKESKN